jgi:hypothetical protein
MRKPQTVNWTVGAFAGMDEVDFIKFLGRNNVSIFGSVADIMEEYQNA